MNQIENKNLKKEKKNPAQFVIKINEINFIPYRFLLK